MRVCLQPNDKSSVVAEVTEDSGYTKAHCESAALIDNGQVDEGAAFDGAEDRFGKFHVFHTLVES